MKFFQKRWVAVTICILMILVAVAISQGRKNEPAYEPNNTETAEEWGKENYDSYTQYVLDDASLLKERTIREISQYNAALDYSFASICSVATVSDLAGINIEEAAWIRFETMDLGTGDFLLLLAEEEQDWFIVFGTDMADYVDQELRILLNGQIDQVLEDPNDALPELFDDLMVWYQDTIPVADSDSGTSSVAAEIGGTLLFISLLTLLIMAAVVVALVRSTRHIVGGGFRRPLFFINPFGPRNTYRHPHGHHAPPPGDRSGPGWSSSSRSSFGGSGRGGSSRGGSFGGSSRGGSSRGGGFGGSRGGRR